MAPPAARPDPAAGPRGNRFLLLRRPRPRTALQWCAALTCEPCFAAVLVLQFVTWVPEAQARGNVLSVALLTVALGGAVVRTPTAPPALQRSGAWLMLLGLGGVLAVLALP